MISMVLTRMVAAFGAEAIATQRVGGQIESVSWNTADGFAAALNAFVGQNYGAKKMDRVQKGYRISFWTVAIWGALIMLAFIIFPGPIAGVFFHEEKAMEIAISYLIIIGFSEAFMCVELMTIGALSGLGKDKTVQCDQYYGDLYAYSVSNGFKSYLIRSGWNLVGIDADLRSERNHLLSDLPLSDA